MASPRAKALAAAKGVSLAGLRGTGPGGRIIERDVKEALEGRQPPSPAAARPAAPVEAGAAREIKVAGMRKIIAERMHASLATTAQLTMSSAADARELRKKFKGSPESLGLRDITINDMVLFAVSRALLQHANLNAHFTADTIRQFDDVHLAFAIDTPRGLMAPVIRNAHTLSLRDIAREAGRLITACREGGITPDELAGGTFTVTNLGNLGVESFTPILNPPQVGILGVGSIAPRPVQAADGSVSFVAHIGLSLTINHQVVDGAPGARFLQTLANAIAQFDLLLAR
jgi:pyruvate dehydrogenase E2 component (dihydrolipoamide acetyltransferase)